MGFWRSLANYIDRKLEESNERAAAERAERNRRRAIQQDGKDYGYGYQRGIDDAKAERPYTNTRRPSRPQPGPWDIHIPSERETRTIWFGEPERKKKRNDDFW